MFLAGKCVGEPQGADKRKPGSVNGFRAFELVLGAATLVGWMLFAGYKTRLFSCSKRPRDQPPIEIVMLPVSVVTEAATPKPPNAPLM